MIPAVVGVLGCAAGPRVVDVPVIRTPDEAPLTRTLELETAAPSTLTVHLTGPGVDVTVAFPGAATRHDVDLLGAKPDRSVLVEIELADERGTTTLDATFHTDPLPDDFPDIDVLALEPALVEPGYRLLPLESQDQRPYLAAVDAWDGEVAFLYTGPENPGDIELTPEGTLLGQGFGMFELDLRGELLHRWNESGDPDDPTWIGFPYEAEHHEISRVGPDELVTLTKRSIRSDAYPLSYAFLGAVAPADLEDGGVVRFRRDGTVLSTWWLGDVLDRGRVGFNGLTRVRGGYDWSHANAVTRMPDGGWLVSSRHQDALVAFDDAGALRWILASPAGWKEPYSNRVLALDGPAPYHQHGPSFDAAGDLVVFDNHNDGHNPYEPEPAEPPESRVVAWTIDEETRTASESWSWRHPDRLHSTAMGNATALPGGTVVACWGFLDEVGGEPNGAQGFGRKVSRVVELLPGREDPVSDLRLSYPLAESEDGILLYRAVPTPTLYPEAVEVRRLAP